MPTPLPDHPEDLPTLVLIERAQSEDGTAMERLFERFLPRVRRIAAIRLGRTARDVHDIDDLVQEALLDAFRGLQNFDTCSDGRLLGWLGKIVENRLRSTLRQDNRQKRGGERVRRFADASQTFGPSKFAAAGPSPSQNAVGAEMDARISGMIHELPEQQREIIILRLYCQLSYDEVAEELGLSGPDTARALYSRGLRALGTRVRPKPAE
ncbi:MAG: sigma-70 family RNA polymerase sigma factor [Planctomycetes bacterium]|nr:sigma-70 family RNA polymerase sigma factor [Planctomycetota bacterium]